MSDPIPLSEQVKELVADLRHESRLDYVPPHAQVSMEAAANLLASLHRDLQQAQQERDAARRSAQETYERFGHIFRELGLFDGARPESPEAVIDRDVLPAIRALKGGDVGPLVKHAQEALSLWSYALQLQLETFKRLQAAEQERDAARKALEELTPRECAHGHKAYQVGCVSCVLVHGSAKAQER